MSFAKKGLCLLAAGLMFVPVHALAQNAPAKKGTVPECRVLPPQKADQIKDRFEERLFKRVDTNRDNAISREEFLRQASQRFDRLDVNRDGKLSREEIHSELMGTEVRVREGKSFELFRHGKAAPVPQP